MTLTINDDHISSDQIMHTAGPVPGHDRGWEVSWLPGRIMDRNTAITAMTIADIPGPDDLHTRHRLWPHIESWARELGLTATDALVRAVQPPGSISAEKDTAVPADPEAAGS